MDVSYSSFDTDDPAFIGLELDFYANPRGSDTRRFLFRNREYLEYQFLKMYQFGVHHNVPMSVMEFGTMGRTFDVEGKGGENWVADMLRIFEKYDTSFSLWNYHGSSMGIFRSEVGMEPAQPNTKLIATLKENLSGQMH